MESKLNFKEGEDKNRLIDGERGYLLTGFQEDRRVSQEEDGGELLRSYVQRYLGGSVG